MYFFADTDFAKTIPCLDAPSPPTTEAISLISNLIFHLAATSVCDFPG
ncbi:hypothetical protein [Clostridium acidisoli]|nr:hypothetical protein [Clostridium acidisoli]